MDVLIRYRDGDFNTDACAQLEILDIITGYIRSLACASELLVVDAQEFQDELLDIKLLTRRTS